MTVPVDPIAIALSVSHVLDSIGIRHTIGGSIASSFAGEPRSTVDIDFVAALEESHIPAIISALSVEQLKRRQAVALGQGRTLYVHPPEDILLQELRWYRAGGEVSDRQWRDVLGIIRVQGTSLDRDYLTGNAPILGVADVLARALREAVP